MLFLSLLMFVSASLVFTSLVGEKRPMSVKYTPTEIQISQTIIKLNGHLSVSGLNAQDFLLCFREGNLIFPLNPADQHSEHELPVEEGDHLVWVHFDRQMVTFQQVLWNEQPTEEHFEMHLDLTDSLYRFQVGKSVSTMDSARSTLETYRLCGWNCMVLACPIFILLSILSILIILIPLTSVGNSSHRRHS